MGWRKRGGRRGSLVPAMKVMLAAAIALAAPAAAQVTGNTPAPAPSATPLPVPPAPVIVIPTATATPTPTPTPTAARPRATPTPRETPAPPRASASPTPSASRTTAPAPEPSASAAPATPVASPPPAPTPAPTAPVAPAPAASPVAGGGGLADYWPIAAGVIAAALLALGWAAQRRRREERWEAAQADDADEAEFAPDFPVATAARARLSLAFRPIRAGLNLLSATSESEITVTNTGDAPAEDIRLLARLISAHTGQDAELAAIYASPIGRPATPAFTLQPGEQRVLTTIAALPRDAIRALDAGGRPMFVPLVAVNAIYATGGLDAQFAQAFAIGVERVDSPKLAPFWLDAPPRTYDQVAARPHAAALER